MFGGLGSVAWGLGGFKEIRACGSGFEGRAVLGKYWTVLLST